MQIETKYILTASWFSHLAVILFKCCIICLATVLSCIFTALRVLLLLGYLLIWKRWAVWFYSSVCWMTPRTEGSIQSTQEGVKDWNHSWGRQWWQIFGSFVFFFFFSHIKRHLHPSAPDGLHWAPDGSNALIELGLFKDQSLFSGTTFAPVCLTVVVGLSGARWWFIVKRQRRLRGWVQLLYTTLLLGWRVYMSHSTSAVVCRGLRSDFLAVYTASMHYWLLCL